MMPLTANLQAATRRCALTLLASIALIVTAHAQTGAKSFPVDNSVPIMAFGDVEGLDLQPLVAKKVPAEKLGNIRKNGLGLYFGVRAFKQVCVVSTGVTAPVDTTKVMPRMPSDFAWAGSLYRAGEAKELACGRSIARALEILAGAERDFLSEARLREIAPRLGQTDRPVFSRAKEAYAPKDVWHATYGTMNESGTRELASILGDRWTTILDSRRFGVHAVLLAGDTIEKRRYCMAEFGLAAVPPDGMRTRVPRSLAIAVSILPAGAKDDASACQQDLLESTATMLRDSYQDQLDEFAKFQAEPGMTYPSSRELREALARYDSAQAKAQRTVATGRSGNVVRCSNQCANGSCVRTFENGRQERWQAPRVYNPTTQNWEWDISTNACGG